MSEQNYVNVFLIWSGVDYRLPLQTGKQHELVKKYELQSKNIPRGENGNNMITWQAPNLIFIPDAAAREQFNSDWNDAAGV